MSASPSRLLEAVSPASETCDDVTEHGCATQGTHTLREASSAGRGAAPLPRATVVGRYLIRELIGAGGMGEVYAARDTELGREIALKLIHGRAVSSEGATRRECERLRAEAQALARLSHPNVVHVYEVGEYEGGTFLAMELVEGPTLAQWQWETLPELLGVYVQAGRGLAAAHAAGLAHRDFKPGNVLIGLDDRVRVVDFGLAVPARLAEEGAATIGDESEEPAVQAPASSSEAGSEPGVGGPGTLPYMAPEQAFHGAGGPAGDQFSFCVALFEAVYGARPFPAKTVMELLYKLDTCTIEYPADAPAVPRWLRRLLERGLSRQPEDRFPSMDALVAELARDRRRVWNRLAFAAVVAGLTAIAVLGASPGQPAPAPAAPSAPVLDGVWDAQARRELSGAFAAVDAPWVAGSEAAVVSGIDDWSRRWNHVAREAGELRDPLARRALTACLDAQRAHAQVTIAALAEGSPALLEGAVAAVDALPEPSRCVTADALGTLATADPEALLPELRTLADAAAQRGLGNFELAVAGSDAVLREARARGWSAVELAALRQRGLAELDAGRRAEGLEDLEAARALAVRSGDRRAEAELFVELAWAGRELDNPELRRDRLELARAHVEALLAASDSSQADRHARLLDARVRLVAALDELEQRGLGPSERSARAEALLLEGLAELERIDAGDSSLAIDYLHALAHVRDRAGALEEAEYDYRRALTRAERVRGREHPSNARLWYDAGALAHERGQLELARERLERARDIRRAALRVDHPELARSELGLAQLEFQDHDYVAAKRHAQAALRSLERATGPSDALPETLRLLGQLDAREGHYAEAAAHYERALGLMDPAGDLSEIQRALVELELGKALVALGEPERGVELLDASLPVIAERLGPDRCAQLVPSYERQAEAALAMARRASARASLEAALACTGDPETRARLDAELARVR